MTAGIGQVDIRSLNVNKLVTGFALRTYRFKQECTQISSSSFQERYFSETAADLTQAGSPVEGVPRMAQFPSQHVTWTQHNSYHIKHGLQDTIAYEDLVINEIDALRRTTLRISRAIAKSVDANIFNTITEGTAGVPSASPTNILEYDIAAGNEWDSATIANRDPVQDLLDARALIDAQDYDSSMCSLWVNPSDWAKLLGNPNVRNAGQFFTDDVTRNGNIGFLLGMKVIVSNNVTSDYAVLVIPNEACTWVTLKPMQTALIEEPGISTTIRCWEEGVAQLKNPKAVCLISNTRA